MASQVTIYDVAREAGVSISTVSNALNRPERVSAATRERVLDVADRLGFVPKPAAVQAGPAGHRLHRDPGPLRLLLLVLHQVDRGALRVAA